MSCTRSSSSSPDSAVTSRRPVEESAASRCSTPNRARRSRCSTTMVVALGSASRRASLRRLEFMPEPTSVTTSLTESPWGGGPRAQPGHLRIEVAALVVGGHAGIDHGATGSGGGSNIDQDETSHPLRRDRQAAFPEPAVRGELAHAHLSRPVRQVHTPTLVHMYDH